MRRNGHGQRCVLALAVVIGATLIAMPGQAGGGSWLTTTELSYEPGDVVVAVGYTLAQFEETPQLQATISRFAPEYEQVPTWELSPVYAEKTGLGGYLSVRVSVAFTVPLAATDGQYNLSVRDVNGGVFGDLNGGFFWVGPPEGDIGVPAAEWPLNEPMIAQLPKDAVISGPYFSVTAGDLQSGNYPDVSTDMYLPDPSSLRQPEMASVTPVISPAPVATTSTSTTIAPSSKTTSGANSFIELRQPAPVTTAEVVASTPTSAETEHRESIAAKVIPTAVLLVMAILTIGIGVLATRRILRPNILPSESADRFGDLVEERGDRR